MRVAVAFTIGLVFAPWTAGGEIPAAVVVLEVFSPNPPGQAPQATPPRFVLLEGGQVFVGGTSDLASGRLESGEVKAIEKRIAQVRKLAGVGSEVTLGRGGKQYRFSVKKPRPLDIVATGDPAASPAALQPLAALLRDLEGFDHPSLRPYRADVYALSAREAALPGGCRSWSFAVPLAECLSSPRMVSAAAAKDWPTGATPASVCAGDRKYVVTLRPLLPGERP